MARRSKRRVKQRSKAHQALVKGRRRRRNRVYSMVGHGLKRRRARKLRRRTR